MSASRYVPIPPDRLGAWRALKRASYLHDFLIDRQTDADGRVFYGRAITYGWIRENWPDDDPPALRTLQRFMSVLKRLGIVQIWKDGMRGGMRIRLVTSVKWPGMLPAPAVQLNLFTPAPIPIRRGDVGNVSKSFGNAVDMGSSKPPDLAGCPPSKPPDLAAHILKKQEREKFLRR